MIKNLRFLLFIAVAGLLISCSEEVQKSGSGTVTSDSGSGSNSSDEVVIGAIVDVSVQPDPSQISDIDGETRVVYEMYKTTETPHTNPELFEVIDELTDEFDGGVLDETKWTNFVGNFQSDQTLAENVWVNAEGCLQLQVNKLEDAPVQVTYSGSLVDYYYSTAMIRSKTSIVYGYFEAHIRGSNIEKGTCPALWLYNIPYLQSSSDAYENKVCYNEIDIIEIQQVSSDYHIQSQNYHMMVWTEGDDGSWGKSFIRPYDIMGQNECITAWHPNDDFHLYACENRPDSIIWYIDNVRVASKPNLFWHLETELAMSVGIRTPLQKYVDSVATAVPFDESSGYADLLPAVCDVEYIRSWTRKGGYDSYRSSKREYDASQFPMDVD